VNEQTTKNWILIAITEKVKDFVLEKLKDEGFEI